MKLEGFKKSMDYSTYFLSESLSLEIVPNSFCDEFLW